ARQVDRPPAVLTGQHIVLDHPSRGAIVSSPAMRAPERYEEYLAQLVSSHLILDPKRGRPGDGTRGHLLIVPDLLEGACELVHTLSRHTPSYLGVGFSWPKRQSKSSMR